MKRGKRYWLRTALVGAWIVFTVSLTAWWIIFGLDQIDRLMAIDHADMSELVSHQKMILWEGAALFLSFVAGGGALVYFMYREMRQTERLHTFLATFTHELRTPLANVRLQAELLKECVKDEAAQATLNVLVAETGRLTLQLENCLFLADRSKARYHFEEVPLEETLLSLSDLWPKVKIMAEPACWVRVDRRAWQSVLQNIIQNAVVHGGASAITIRSHAHSTSTVRLTITDNGRGFQGDARRLGRLFERFYPGSGSGIGIYLVKKLISRLGGTFRIAEVLPHFSVEVVLPGRVEVGTKRSAEVRGA